MLNGGHLHTVLPSGLGPQSGGAHLIRFPSAAADRSRYSGESSSSARNMASGLDLSLAERHENVTVLFADIRGFTEFAQHAQVRMLVCFL